FGLFNVELLLRSGDVELARTLAVNVFVFGEMFYLFNCRSITKSMWSLGFFSNKWLIAGVAMMTLLQLAYTYTPLFNRIFESRPMGISEWAMVIGSSTLIYIIVGFEKYLKRK
ncbi:MAG: cation transporting ATPase C-terminal domain-containing protein, partial [Desulfobulbaceae bacterium]|nr:cation transporting ATPase C-terminal domain-containing protein [Desulfobulbaceae bacterium]